ncbi:2-amino-4-hydroxy-6-hydroxymethyldihydropteridine diphosphokinase [Jonesia denitrificans]|uniref:Bifunctional folate synthesis protein n=1 Tax=Jonesia denitrificans (strain ATCC 14870 / DSM 20603 / BCRC 15368 / CIP 55.134 / JCM 11481 / NBRC 15587 / NCTC 10816 / Prevot 55134) TaxID=471856 RepID=C7R114_JONDD|nr:2-amino-4-hydroxy-6-hydroxymethyldihydropteridine diphosphokinase [Jonesia denitrificans]ACV09738.1 2-amino-4-hydroxy-6- hydroxymethyldihydropteridine pyrophosphokinase [Jonesia denitrificans DSM 20603]ASE09050.1 2-amino-4-hydroxy-6-hydroxymethyldihydropteridine diphosphokinase [Jonesia denitrificans]SQH22318.1 2-amino-4-hydroxy-6-hydroxymethyldihydropteridinepyrophosphokinase [Jonesia denitrificans]
MNAGETRSRAALDDNDTITLTGLQATGYHGVLSSERDNGQTFIVDVTLALDTQVAARTDDLTETVNYALLAEDIHGVITGEPVNLIETLAQKIAETVLSYAQVSACTVTVHKPQAPISVAFGDVAVTISRTQDDLVAGGVYASAPVHEEPASPGAPVAGEEPVVDTLAPSAVSAQGNLPSFDEFVLGVETPAGGIPSTSDSAQDTSSPDSHNEADEPFLPTPGHTGFVPVVSAAEPSTATTMTPIVSAMAESLDAQDEHEPTDSAALHTVVPTVADEQTPQFPHVDLPQDRDVIIPVLEPDEQDINGSHPPSQESPNPTAARVSSDFFSGVAMTGTIPVVAATPAEPRRTPTLSELLGGDADTPLDMSKPLFAMTQLPESDLPPLPKPFFESAPTPAPEQTPTPAASGAAQSTPQPEEPLNHDDSEPQLTALTETTTATDEQPVPADSPAGASSAPLAEPTATPQLSEQPQDSHRQADTTAQPPLAVEEQHNVAQERLQSLTHSPALTEEDDAPYQPVFAYQPLPGFDRQRSQPSPQSPAPISVSSEPQQNVAVTPPVTDPVTPTGLTPDDVVQRAVPPVSRFAPARPDEYSAPAQNNSASPAHTGDHGASEPQQTAVNAPAGTSEVRPDETPRASSQEHLKALRDSILKEAEVASGDSDADEIMDRAPGQPARVVLALGANLGDAQRALSGAVHALKDTFGFTVLDIGPLARTGAVGGPDQPDYLNTVIVGETELSPRELLRATQAIENAHGRTREERWGPRTLDIDIITYEGVNVASAELEIPHPRAHERAFVLVPWAQIDPDAVLPGLGGGPVADLADTAPDRAGVRWLALDWVTGEN